MINLARGLHEYMEIHHHGQNKAIPRTALLMSYVWLYDKSMDDRDFRKLYIKLPVAACAKGIFIPATKEENRRFYEYMLNKKMTKEAAWARIEIILRYYPKLDWRGPDPNQGVLFS